MVEIPNANFTARFVNTSETVGSAVALYSLSRHTALKL